MSDLEKIREWISTYPGTERLQDLWVDYYAPAPDNGSIAPAGLVEVSRNEDILGNIVVENQYNFGLYYVLTKATADDTGATENAEWIMGLQKWVQEQSIRKLAPIFGDEPATERILAQNGALYAADEEGTATYIVQLSIKFKKIYEVM
mgnify:CR=1 FL=1